MGYALNEKGGKEGETTIMIDGKPVLISEHVRQMRKLPSYKAKGAATSGKPETEKKQKEKERKKGKGKKKEKGKGAKELTNSESTVDS